MNVHKRYKMYKKGKKWCCMALTTFVAILGVLTTTQTANADVVNENQTVLLSSVEADTTNENSSSTDLKAVSENSSASSQNSGVSQAIISSPESKTVSSENVPNSSIEDITLDSKSIQNTESSTANQVSPVSDTEKNKAILDSAKNSNVEAVSMTSLPASTIKNGLETENTNTYYYENGQQLKNAFKNINGKMYYFNSNGVMVKDYFYKNWGHTYYFQKDGSRLDDGFYSNWGNTYYFGNGGVRLDDGFYSNWGHMYYFGNGGVRLDDGFYNNWGNTYYFGNGGVRLDNSFYNNWGNLYYFGSDGALQKNKQVSVNLTRYWASNDGVLTPQFDNGVNQYIINNHIGHASITYYNAIPENITGIYSGTSDGKPNMIVVHETANPNDNIWGEINYEKSHYNSAFVHAFVDNNSIIQISDTDHEAWGAAYPANGRAVQFEQVEVYGGWNFAAELVNAAYYTAYKMKQYGMYPRIADGDLSATLWSHHDVSRYLGGTDHTDPDSYWSNRAWTNFGTGYGMWDFTMLVNYEYALLQ